jgi:hypothetical protein
MRPLTVLLFALALGALAPTAQAGAMPDTTKNTAVTAVEGDGFYSYRGTVSALALNSAVTRAMYVGEVRRADSLYFRAVNANVVGTEDVDVFVEFSADRANWQRSATAVLTQVSTTLMQSAKVPPTAGRGQLWMRLRFDGQTGNPSTTLRWQVYVPKAFASPARAPVLVANSVR